MGGSGSLEDWTNPGLERRGEPHNRGSLSSWELGCPYCARVSSPSFPKSGHWPQSGVKTVGNLQIHPSGVPSLSYLLSLSSDQALFRISLFWTHPIYTVLSTRVMKMYQTLFLVWEKITSGKVSRWGQLDFSMRTNPADGGRKFQERKENGCRSRCWDGDNTFEAITKHLGILYWPTNAILCYWCSIISGISVGCRYKQILGII